MTAPVRPRRSVLYMPGSNERALDKGRSLPADVLILDLEDAVAPEAKELARKNIQEALSEGGYGNREILIRVNHHETDWGKQDLVEMANTGAHGILLPKVDSGADVKAAQEILDANGAPEELTLWCMIETPMAILHIKDIAASTPRLAGFVMGTSDLAKDLHCLHTPSRLPFMSSLNLSVLAARAYGLAILDGVYLDLSDSEGFAESCQQGLELGFDGKTLIHPKTIETANTIFAPSADELDQSRAIIAAFEDAAEQGKGVIVLNGKLVENLHVENARRVLALADMISALES